MMSTHGNRIMRLRKRRSSSAEIGLGADGNGRPCPAAEVLLASVTSPHATHPLLSLPQAVLGGERLTGFLGQVAPFGCPAPPSLIRAYSLPDAPYPSVLLKEHEDAPAGTGDAYRRFVLGPRHRWLAALEETGPGLCPVLAWQAGAARPLLRGDERARAGADGGIAVAGFGGWHP